MKKYIQEVKRYMQNRIAQKPEARFISFLEPVSRLRIQMTWKIGLALRII